jgi:hypothetical protein
MDWNDIDKLRDPGFALERRGYDRHAVDKLLGSLVDWLETDAVTDLGDLAVKRKLELVGKSTSRILLTTEQEAEQMRRRAQEECDELWAETEAKAQETRQAADRYSAETRQAADDYSAKTRDKAEQDARRTESSAAAQAQKTVEEGERRRANIEAAIAELDTRRKAAIGELERLRTELATAIGIEPPAHAKPNGGGEESNGVGEEPNGAGEEAEESPVERAEPAAETT